MNGIGGISEPLSVSLASLSSRLGLRNAAMFGVERKRCLEVSIEFLVVASFLPRRTFRALSIEFAGSAICSLTFSAANSSGSGAMREK
jgi:hypothetical protein